MKIINVGLIFLALQQVLLGAETFGMALQVNGKVAVTRGILEFEAQVEEQLLWDDEIETDGESTMILVFDSSFLSIGPNTKMHFEKRKGPKREDLMVVVLDKGTFRSKILNLGSKQFFEVESEGGRLRVHGTDFVTTVNPDSASSFGVSVLQGRVEISPASSGDKTSNNEAGQGVSEVGKSGVESSVMLTQNKTGGFSGGGQKDVEQISFAQVDGIKQALPIPGDEVASLVMEDFGIKNVSVETLVENIKETQKDLPTEAPVQLAPPEILLRLTFEIVDS